MCSFYSTDSLFILMLPQPGEQFFPAIELLFQCGQDMLFHVHDRSPSNQWLMFFDPLGKTIRYKIQSDVMLKERFETCQHH